MTPEAEQALADAIQARDDARGAAGDAHGSAGEASESERLAEQHAQSAQSALDQVPALATTAGSQAAVQTLAANPEVVTAAAELAQSDAGLVRPHGVVSMLAGALGIETVTNLSTNPRAAVERMYAVDTAADGTASKSRETSGGPRAGASWTKIIQTAATGSAWTDRIRISPSSALETVPWPADRGVLPVSVAVLDLLGSSVKLLVVWRDAAGTQLSTASTNFSVVPGQWQRVAAQFVPPAGAAGVDVRVSTNHLAQEAGHGLGATEWMIGLDGPYVDGDTDGMAWDGATGLSTSTGVRPEDAAPALAAAAASSVTVTSRSDLVVCTGDSITSGGDGTTPWPELLQSALGGPVVVVNDGKSGQTSAFLAIRRGAVEMTTTAASTIPADGSATESIPFSQAPFVGKVRDPADGMAGYLNGVHGVMVFSSSNAGVFTPDAAPGTAVSMPSGTKWVSDGVGSQWDEATTIVWLGQNDLAYGWPYVVTAPNAAAVAVRDQLTPVAKRILAIGVTTTNASHLTNVTEQNLRLRDTFGEQFIDMQNVFINRGLAMAGIDPTEADQTAIAAGLAPGSLFADGVHPNAICKQKVIVPTIIRAMARLGWL